MIKKLFLILLLGLILRLIVVNQSFWLDEAITAETVKNLSFTNILTQFPRFDFHPPLYYLILKVWTYIFGFSEFALRLPSIIFGLATIIVVYKIAFKIIPNKSYLALFPPLLLATSQLHIYYSQEARMYALTCFLASLSVCFFLDVLAGTKNRTVWWLFSFSITLLIFTDYAPLLFLPVFPVMGLLAKKNLIWWKNFTLIFVPLTIAVILWLPMLITQLKALTALKLSLPGWNSIIGGNSFKETALIWTKFIFGRISLSNRVLYYLLLLVSSFLVLIPLIKSMIKPSNKTKMTILWFILPTFFGFLISFITPVLSYFRFLFLLPAFYILIAAGISRFNKSLSLVFVLLLLGMNALSWLIYIFDPVQQRENWRDATAFVDAKVTPDEIVLFTYPEPVTPYRWYSKGVNLADGATASVAPDSVKTHDRTLNLVKTKNGVYYFEYLGDLSDPAHIVVKTLTAEGFSVKEVYNFIGVGQVFFYTK